MILIFPCSTSRDTFLMYPLSVAHLRQSLTISLALVSSLLSSLIIVSAIFSILLRSYSGLLSLVPASGGGVREKGGRTPHPSVGGWTLHLETWQRSVGGKTDIVETWDMNPPSSAT